MSFLKRNPRSKHQWLQPSWRRDKWTNCNVTVHASGPAWLKVRMTRGIDGSSDSMLSALLSYFLVSLYRMEANG